MIKLVKDTNADSRSSKVKITLPNLQLATANHIVHVSQGLEYFANLLIIAGEKHDFTKSDNMEDFYKALTSDNIKNTVSFTWYKKHVVNERHHLLSNVPEDVNLVDVFEHLVDCVMAGSARTGKIFDVDLPDAVLQKAVKNTVELLKKQIEMGEVDK
jgi:hypothetical protein